MAQSGHQEAVLADVCFQGQSRRSGKKACRCLLLPILLQKWAIGRAWEGERGSQSLPVAVRPEGSGGFDALALTHATLTQRTPWAVAAVWQRTSRAGAGSGRWLRA